MVITPVKIDELTYGYNLDGNGTLINNRLRHVKDAQSALLCDYDIDNQNDDNYLYDAIGNLTKDNAEGIDNIEWNAYGKIKKIIRTFSSAEKSLEFVYDAQGNRVCKIVKPRYANMDGTKTRDEWDTYNSASWLYTFYVRDASGNIMTTYTKTGSEIENNVLKLDEVMLYGSGRIGTREIGVELTNITTPTVKFSRTLGLKRYEIGNHLGNVLTTFTDRKYQIQNTGVVTGYKTYIASSQDYYPFGMIMNERKWNTSGYRFGFNGQEKDNEIYGNGNATTALFWEYDPRIGRRWNRDPKPTVGISEYACLLDNPILYLDPDGDYSKFGAKMRNFFNGGSGISYTKSTGEWGYNKGTNEGVEYRDGLTQTERKQKIDDYKKTHYLHKEFGWIEIDQLNEYKPDFYDRWSESKNIFKKLLYGAFDDASVTVQNVFIKNLGDGNAYHLNGEMSTPKENTDAYVNISIDLVPEVKITKGLTLLKRMNAAQFSKVFKGTFSRLRPTTRGFLNRNINKIVVNPVNNEVSSGGIVKSAIQYLPKQDKDKDKDNK